MVAQVYVCLHMYVYSFPTSSCIGSRHLSALLPSTKEMRAWGGSTFTSHFASDAPSIASFSVEGDTSTVITEKATDDGNNGKHHYKVPRNPTLPNPSSSSSPPKAAVQQQHTSLFHSFKPTCPPACQWQAVAILPVRPPCMRSFIRHITPLKVVPSHLAVPVPAPPAALSSSPARISLPPLLPEAAAGPLPAPTPTAGPAGRAGG